MQTTAQTLTFTARLYEVQGVTIIRLPSEVSKQLSSRGQVAVECVINDHNSGIIVVEPDGDWGHWIRITDVMQKKHSIHSGDTTTFSILQTKNWPEPTVPKDLKEELQAAPDKIQTLWKTITPMARYEWVRWVNATRDSNTRARRVEASISKMKSGKRRPCCFNLAACTDPALTKNGRLIEESIS